MTLTVLLFAAARDLAGTDRVTVEVPDGATGRELRAALAARHPALASLLERSRVAVNQEFVGPECMLKGADEIAVIPPVSGG